ncbi:MAG TPA: RidA family protein [Myxococcota bacterium]|nr:RidA family protein [Myxococcota bacterium]HOD06615.1 RidA family protein [Myxococcota bacterium]HPB50868.1 RidA family protein [Myxococcota bacterium]HQP95916.1 RidA family protein [Myxococcota bacterium]
MKGNMPVHSDDAPAAIGPYSQAIECRPSRMMFVSGQIPIDPATGVFAPGGASEQAVQALKNIDAILKAGGMDRTNVVRATVFLVNMADFGAVNAVYAEFFGDHKPARAAFQVSALPKGALVEIDAIAAE